MFRRLEVHHLRVPLRKPWATAHGTIAHAESVLLRGEAEQGVVWAESCPLGLPGYTAETAASVAALVVRQLGPPLLGVPWDDLPAVLARHPAPPDQPFAAAAVDLLVWLARAHQRRLPLHALLGGGDAPVALGDGVGLAGTTDELIAQVRAAVAAGWRRIKLKLAPGPDALARLAAVRAAVPEAPLFVDANGAFSRADLPLFLALDRLDLTMIEQPLPAADLAGHAWLQRRLRTPLCLDESIASLADAEAALRLGAARIINLKPGRVGGLTPALAILQRCRAAGVDCYVGTMFETGVGASINLALASVPGCTLPASNLCSGRYLALDIVSPPLAIAAPGAILPIRQPGLGRQVEEGLVGRVTLARYEVPPAHG